MPIIQDQDIVKKEFGENWYAERLRKLAEKEEEGKIDNTSTYQIFYTKKSINNTGFEVIED